jgi:hypothetical protein
MKARRSRAATGTLSSWDAVETSAGAKGFHGKPHTGAHLAASVSKAQRLDGLAGCQEHGVGASEGVARPRPSPIIAKAPAVSLYVWPIAAASAASNASARGAPSPERG